MLKDGQSYDLVIVGSGAASICAALLAKDAGRSVIIVEKEDKIGGSTALSGGVLWIPNNPIMKEEGIEDSYEKGLAYLNACAGDPAPGSTVEQRHAFIKEGPGVVSYLLSKGMKLFPPRGYSDYHESEYPGAVPGGRSLVGPPYDLRKLGKYADKLRRHPAGAEFPVSVPEASRISITGQTLESKLTYIKVGLRILRNKLGAKIVGMGGSIQGQLLRIALDNGIEIVTEAKVEDMIMEGDRVAGVIVSHEGKQLRVLANKGVLLNTGGFARNDEMRKKYQPLPNDVGWTQANPGDTGEIIEQAKRHGAATSRMGLSVWVMSTVLPEGVPVFVLGDMAKPHAICVDQTGERYVNEATSYVAIGLAMYERNKTVPTIPSWIVMDSQHRRKYFLAGQRAKKIPQAWLDKGFIIEGATIEDLAAKTGMDPAKLRATVDRFNGFARAGVDQDFHRGRSAFDRFFGDASMPNASLGTVEEGPFFAVRMVPGDVGTYGGMVTDEKARVLREDGSVINGLYACGNATAPVTGPSYPGAGASIGASLVFGYIAARDALGVNS